MNILTSVQIFSRLALALAVLCCVNAGRVLADSQGNAAAPQANSQAAAVPTAPETPYRLQAGDVIEIRLFYNPELNEQVQIRPDGRVSLQLIGEVELASKTIEQAVSFLQEKYVKDVRTPEMTIQVKTYGSQKVYVVGEVLHPGMLALPGPMTVYDAISEAGGIKLTGNRKVALLLRKGPNGAPEERRLMLFDKGALTADASMPLGPFDVVMVPESKISRMDRWVDQTIRQMAPFIMSAGFNYLLSHQVGGAGSTVPIF
jgi:polysaccharide export outer membrane protein